MAVRLREPSIALVGPNESGRSTFLHLLDGLVLPSSGRVWVDGLNPEHDAAAVRRRASFAFIDPEAQLVMPTAVEDVTLSLRRLGVLRGERQSQARAILQAQSLGASADARVRELPSGQRQLLALRSVLATGPRVLVGDEPTTLLGLHLARRIGDVLLGAAPRLIVATHDLGLATRCDRAPWIEKGQVRADGSAAEVVDVYSASA